jgi:hypothetical protein
VHCDRIGPLAALVTLLHVGCATFDEPPVIGEPPDATGVTLRIDVADIRYDEVRRRDAWKSRPPTTGEGRVAAALRETGWFALVGPNVQNAEYEGGITVHRFHESLSRASASFLTAFLLPTALDHLIRVEGFVTLGGPGTTISCVREDGATTWYQLFLVFLYPWHSPTALDDQLVDHLARECIADILREVRDEDLDDDPEPVLYPASDGG